MHVAITLISLINPILNLSPICLIIELLNSINIL
nr:MAG TPA: hypothetical protein [Crassvirales sp.]